MRGPWWLWMGLAGCPYVGGDGLDRLRDVDGDGLDSVRYLGRDCDDNDPAVGDCDLDRDGHQAIGFGDDCDDADPAVHPGAEEACTPAGGVPRDEDCDGRIDDADEIDDALKASWFVDGDGDGYGANVPVLACAAPPGTVDNDGDCDDTSSAISPDAEERCDAPDRNCDGDPVLDAVDAVDWYSDADGDGYGRADAFVVRACEAPVGAGVLAGGQLEDCDDQDPARNPAAQEVCAGGLDDDCDGLVDDADPDVVADAWYLDEDGDGYGASASVVRQCASPGPGYVNQPGDCDDGDGSVTTVRTWIVDADGDGFGVEGADPTDPTQVLTQCARPVGFVANAEDCDDTRSSVNDIAQELCNGFDDNCNGLADDDDPDVAAGYPWYYDGDGDGFGVVFAGRAGTPTDSPIYACVRPSGPWTGLAGDCDDTLATVSPVIPERCNGVDDNCDGQVDVYAVDEVTSYADLDGDGFGDALDPGTTGCPVGSVSLNSADCDDGDAGIRPSAPEICDGADNDCDGLVDDADPNAQDVRWFRDGDGDGVGIAGVFVDQCEAPSGFTSASGDCDDSDARVQDAVAFVPDDWPTVAAAVQHVCSDGAVLLDPDRGPYPVGGVVPRSMLVASEVAGERATVCPDPVLPAVGIPFDVEVVLQDLTLTDDGPGCAPFTSSAWLRPAGNASLTLDHVGGEDLALADTLILGTGASVTLKRVDLAGVSWTGADAPARAVVSVDSGVLLVEGLSIDGATGGRLVNVERADRVRLFDVQVRGVSPPLGSAVLHLDRVNDGLLRAVDVQGSGTAMLFDRGSYEVAASRVSKTEGGRAPARWCARADVQVTGSVFQGATAGIRVLETSGCATVFVGADPMSQTFEGCVFAAMDSAFDGPGGVGFVVDRSVFVDVGGSALSPQSLLTDNVGLTCTPTCPSSLDACFTQSQLDFVLAASDVCAPTPDVPVEQWLLAPRMGSVLLTEASADGTVGYGITAGRLPAVSWLPDSDLDGDGMPDAWEQFFTGDPEGVDPTETCVSFQPDDPTCIVGAGYDDGVWPAVPADAFPLGADL